MCLHDRPGKVTMVAAMRKLILILNAVLQDQVSWQTGNYTQRCFSTVDGWLHLSTVVLACNGLGTGTGIRGNQAHSA